MGVDDVIFRMLLLSSRAADVNVVCTYDTVAIDQIRPVATVKLSCTTMPDGSSVCNDRKNY
jgi:hypothetical protein